MKKILEIIILLAMLVPASSCQKETVESGKIDIMCQFEELSIDLNISDNPYITSVVNSETELESIEMYLVYSDGQSEQFKTTIRTFNSPTRHSIYERPVYTDDMTAFRITAKDKGGGACTKEIKLNITGLVTSPEVKFGQESISFSEGDEIPIFTFTVTAKSNLTCVIIELIQSGTPLQLVPDVVSFETPMTYSFDSKDHFMTDYDVNKIPTAIRVTAYDSYEKIGQSLLPIKYKALPSPEIFVEKIPDTDEYTSFTVSGSASSGNGIVAVSYYAIGDHYENLLGTQSFEGNVNCNFSFAVDKMEVLEYVTGIKVIVKDSRNKATEVIAPVKVLPKPIPIDADADLRTILSDISADAKYRSIKLLLAPGANYDLGTSSYVITKTLKLEADPSKPMPSINVGASYAFLTDQAVVDEICFKNIHFNSSKSGSGMFNNSGGCTIGEIIIEGCRFDGMFSTTFLRSSGNSNIGSITLNNNEIYWANTSGTYSMFHLTQGTDRISEISLKNSTIGGVFYLMYNNMSSTSFSLEVSRCTFVNQKGSSSGYYISCTSSSLSGTITLIENLFGGTNNVKARYRILRANKLSVQTSENWCTKSWKTFSDDGTNGSINPISILPDNEDNADIFANAEEGDYTLINGTSVYSKKIGDPRWIK